MHVINRFGTLGMDIKDLNMMQGQSLVPKEYF